ncbi:MAG: GNAT family N-acetyltransferase [Kofleriaceae bacterium]|nr:GNAT family N-acetyltransferase [Kofleriaceae bacterium]
MPRLSTSRLELVPMTVDVVDAVLAADRARAEALVGAAFPEAWPGSDLVARAFPYAIDAIRAAPEVRLWGDTLMLTRDASPRVVGSVVFHGLPADGIAEVGYGVEEASRGQGLASEGTLAVVEWALAQPGIVAVQATTFTWHAASLRVIHKLGMTRVGARDHDTLGELVVFERRR